MPRNLIALFALASGLIAILSGPIANPALAGKYNQVLNIGDAAPSWAGLIGVDDQPHSLEDWSTKKVVVVVFTCNSCPYAVDAEDRLIDLAKRYAAQGVAFVAINANKVPEDSPIAMKERAKEKAFPFAYLYDETQQTARAYGAMVTPECYVLDAQRKVRYMGSIDDSPDGKQIQQKFLQTAIDSVLGGEAPGVSETVPIGCRVRYQRRSTRTRRRATPD